MNILLITQFSVAQYSTPMNLPDTFCISNQDPWGPQYSTPMSTAEALSSSILNSNGPTQDHGYRANRCSFCKCEMGGVGHHVRQDGLDEHGRLEGHLQELERAFFSCQEIQYIWDKLYCNQVLRWVLSTL